jgi:outer membrane protein assembly factor BamB
VLGPTAPAIPPGPNATGFDSGYSSYGDRYALSSPAMGPDGTLYIGHADGLYALAGPDGAVKWHAGDSVVASSPAVGADGTVFFGAMDGKARAASPEGKILWSVQTGGQVNASPAIGADGAVFFASDDGLVYAVE